jgi:hypothetical protein
MTNRPGEYAWIPCRICGSLVLTTSPRTTCQECRYEAQQAKRHRCFRKMQDTDAKLIYDPIPIEEGGFTKGIARFNDEELTAGIPKGCFVEGTKFDIRGVVKVVCRRKDKYELITEG